MGSMYEGIRFPAQCGSCGLVFGSAIKAAGGFGIALRGNKQSCPRCGNLARIIEGTFGVQNGVVEILEASDADIRLLRQVGLAAVQALEKDRDLAEVVREIGRLIPSLRKLIGQIKKKREIIALLMAIVGFANREGAHLPEPIIHNEYKIEIQNSFNISIAEIQEMASRDAADGERKSSIPIETIRQQHKERGTNRY